MEHFEHSGLTFDVRDGGNPDGEAVILLHGFPQDSTSWSQVVPALHAAGLRTLAPDLRGYSPGARPTSRRAYTARELTGDVIALLDRAGLESAHIVGHDWGAALAWFVAGNHPDRVRSLTVLSTPHPDAMVKSMGTSLQGLRSWYMLFFQLPWLPERLLRRGMADLLRRGGLSAGSAAHYAARMREPGALRGALNWYRGVVLGGLPPRRTPAPTTYLWGSGDRFLGRAAADLTRDYVAGPYRFVELDSGHWLPETCPEQVAAAILDQVRANG
jgi:pimeloyl-ACP methyl ester carboxylesterase